MPTLWRSFSPMTRCACSDDASAGEMQRSPALHTPGSHSEGWIDSGPLATAVR